MIAPSESKCDRPSLDDVIAEYLQRDDGRDLGDSITAYPEFAVELRQFVADYTSIKQFFAKLCGSESENPAVNIERLSLFARTPNRYRTP